MVFDCLSTAYTSILVNGAPCGFFPIKRGLRQGDPLSPFLFILVSNDLSRMLAGAQADGWVQGLQCGRSTTTLSHVLYADDMMLLCPGDPRFVEGLMFVVSIFGWLSGLSINHRKCAFLRIHMDETVLHWLAARFFYPVESFPIRYLGLPLSLRS
ncbi:hypothetical protein QJS04_geneDACA018474 [Acorus gramineus]|uniref:Reverse transcriptase domain-containing protein n=1 Tax=Acorus gramineus TaxID=55184 RepID=A0AAV9AXY3_ACOGR|nr:hypothetical protein QJS04_geneDACA018474 [Acorus gramineus]